MNARLDDRLVLADDLRHDIEQIKRHIETAPDEQTEIAYLKTLAKWEAKLARVLGANPPKGL